MAYHIEKGGDLVIDGFEKGIADSPYQGIANMRNVNIKYYSGVAYTNYKRLACTISGGTVKKPTFSAQSPAGLNYIIDDGGQIWKQSNINSNTFNLLGSSPTTGAAGQGIAFWEDYLIVFRQNFIDICGDGTGDAGVTSSNWLSTSNEYYLGNVTNLVLNGSVNVGDTTATINTYTDAGGNSRSTTWFGTSGLYQLTLTSGETIPITLSNNSTVIKFSQPAQKGGSASFNLINLLAGGGPYMTLISRNDGNLYFCNGSNVGALSVPSGSVFVPGSLNSLNVSYSALGLPNYETANWLEELVGNLLVAGNFNIYPWDRVATSWQNPIPIPEKIIKMINILNNIYIFAGYKGNIYLSNGYSAYPFKKIPDYIANSSGIAVKDPQWLWGGIMVHRLRLYFQALAINPFTGSAIVAGIFSIGLVSGNGISLETPGNLVMENQNSFGLVPSTTLAPNGLLINNLQSNLQYDFYISAWSSGGSDVGGIDYNSTSLYSSNEMVIESEIIPVGTALKPRTFEQIEFKFDEPMKSGDSISLYARNSLSDTYQLIGTTSTSVLSFQSPFATANTLQKIQWVQVMVTMSCNAIPTSSSFTPLREIRMR